VPSRLALSLHLTSLLQSTHSSLGKGTGGPERAAHRVVQGSTVCGAPRERQGLDLDSTPLVCCRVSLDDQFTQLQQLQDESNPEFVGEVIGLFFEDSVKLLTDLEQEV